MSTRLERLIYNITEIPERVHRKCDEAINSFPPPPALIQDWEQYRTFLAQFHCHVENHVLGIPARPPDLRMNCSLCWKLLERKFKDSTPQTCFEIVRTGVEGGVPHILRTIAELFAQEYADNLISITVDAYCSNRSAQELLSDASEYVAAYRQVMPSEITEGSAARIPANFRKVLKQHPSVVRQLRRAGA